MSTRATTTTQSRLRSRKPGKPGRPRTNANGRQVSVFLKLPQFELISRAAREARRPRAQFLAAAAVLEAESIIAAPGPAREHDGRTKDSSGGLEVSTWLTSADYDVCRIAADHCGRSLSYFIAEAASAAARECLAGRAR